MLHDGRSPLSLLYCVWAQTCGLARILNSHEWLLYFAGKQVNL